MAGPPYTLGWVYNLKSAPSTSEAHDIIALAVVFSIISVVTTCLRFVIRLRIVGPIRWDDIFIALSTVIGIGYSATAIYQTRWGLGLRAADFPEENVVPFSRVQYSGGPQYCLAVLGFKLSLVMSYLRVAGFNRTYARVLYIVAVAVVISQLIFTFLLSFACSPIAKQWDPSIPGTCIHTLPTYFALGFTSLGWDLLIIVLPFPILRRLQLDTRSKLALCALYGLGFFVTVIQAIRLKTVARLANYTESKSVIEWSIVEINLGVLVANVPAFGKLVKNFSKKVTDGTRSKPDSAVHRTNASRNQSTLLSHHNRSRKEMSVAEDEIELWAVNDLVGVSKSSVWHDTNPRPASNSVSDFDHGERTRGGLSRVASSTNLRRQHIRVHKEIVVHGHDIDS